MGTSHLGGKTLKFDIWNGTRLKSIENMFCAPVRSWVDAIDGIYFCANLFHLYYTNSESEQSYNIYNFFYQFTFF